MPLPTIPSGNVASQIPTGYDIANSCRFNDGDSPQLEMDMGDNPTLETKYSFSCWLKLGQLGTNRCILGEGVGLTAQGDFRIGTDDKLAISERLASEARYDITTTRVFRDVGAWYNIILIFDSTQSTASDRVKIYVNGVRETAFDGTPTYPAEDADSQMNQGGALMQVGCQHVHDGSFRNFMDGYMAEVVFIDGTAYAHTDFGEFDEDSPNIWKPKDVSSLTFGANGYYLDFEDSSNLGNDANGGTDFTETNLAAADQATDTPTNSFATLNPLYKSPNSLTFSEGNCQIQGVSGNGGRFAGGTFAPASGKWYMEIKVTVSGSYPIMGIIDSSSDIRENSAYFVAADSGTNQSGFAIFSNDDVYHNNDNTFDQWQTYATNDIIGLALDMDASTPTITFLKNNGSSEAFTTEAPNSGHYIFPAIGNYMQAAIAYCNFGGCSSFALTSAESDANGYGNFEYAPPSGYLAMCSKNIGENS